jgi:hypothetical protein
MLFASGLLVGLFFLFLVPQKATDRLQSTYAMAFRWPLAAGNGLTRAAQTIARERPVSPEEYRALLTTCQQFRNESANQAARPTRAGTHASDPGANHPPRQR